MASKPDSLFTVKLSGEAVEMFRLMTREKALTAEVGYLYADLQYG